MLLDAGAEVNLPWDRWDVGRRPLALAARCGHLAAYELLAERGATADLDPGDPAGRAVARGESVRLLIARAADLHDCAFDAEGPTPLDCALWGLQNNRPPAHSCRRRRREPAAHLSVWVTLSWVCCDSLRLKE